MPFEVVPNDTRILTTMWVEVEGNSCDHQAEPTSHWFQMDEETKCSEVVYLDGRCSATFCSADGTQAWYQEYPNGECSSQSGHLWDTSSRSEDTAKCEAGERWSTATWYQIDPMPVPVHV